MSRRSILVLFCLVTTFSWSGKIGNEVFNSSRAPASEPIPKQSDTSHEEGSDTKSEHNAYIKDILNQDQETRGRYPSYNIRFTDPGQDPVLSEYRPEHRSRRAPASSTGLSIWTDKKSVLAGDNLKIFAQSDAEGSPNSYINGHKVEFKQNDNGVFEASINSADLKPGLYQVPIRWAGITDSVAFTISNPGVKLTNRYRHHYESDSTLIVEAEVDVLEEGRFHFQASLYKNNGDPIGWTQVARTLPTGTHWITLEFSPALLADTQAEAGNIILKYVGFKRAGMPPMPAPLTMPAYIIR